MRSARKDMFSTNIGLCSIRMTSLTMTSMKPYDWQNPTDFK